MQCTGRIGRIKEGSRCVVQKHSAKGCLSMTRSSISCYAASYEYYGQHNEVRPARPLLFPSFPPLFFSC
jgi:hypothetical protein